MENYNHLPFIFARKKQEYVLESSEINRAKLANRRSVRHFSSENISKKIIENLLMTAASAPSGANKQPWTFCAISNSDIKQKIRIAAEEEEYKSYHGRMNQEWLDDLKPIGTNWQKPFLTDAPWIIVIFRKNYEEDENGKKQNYYVNESVGIAAGMLINAIHNCGLVTLTHTPSPMNFLSKILNRPGNEKPYLLLPVGYPAENATVPDISRKLESEVIKWFE